MKISERCKAIGILRVKLKDIFIDLRCLIKFSAKRIEICKEMVQFLILRYDLYAGIKVFYGLVILAELEIAYAYLKIYLG